MTGSILIHCLSQDKKNVGLKVGKSYFIINDAQPLVLHMLLRPHNTVLTGTERLYYYFYFDSSIFLC